MNIFEKSQPQRQATAQIPLLTAKPVLHEQFLRKSALILPELSELEVIRHFTNLSKKNYCIDTQFYPLGSCTMKYNPRGVQDVAMLPGFLQHHPFTTESASQGFMHCLYELQNYLKAITGMSGVSLTPMAGAQGEWAGVAMIRAYHRDRQDDQRTEMLIPDTAHGTNPASAAMCGFTVKEIPTNKEGDIDVDALGKMLGPKTAGIMLTNPSTLGLFERQIVTVARMVHNAGGLLYYDGANLNAILGKVRPGDMGFDVMHMNLHKTFATPHGGGGPGSGPVAVSQRLVPYLPMPIVGKVAGEGIYTWLTEKDFPKSIGRLSTFMGNAGILLRAYAYIRLLGEAGLCRVAEYATLNANYLMAALSKAGYQVAFKRRATHEFIITLAQEAKRYEISAMDVAKRILDAGFYAPTTYFPLLVPECFLIEPTETESKQTLDAFIEAMQQILHEMQSAPDIIRSAPSRLACKRLDEVTAARELNLVWKPKSIDS